MTWKKTVIFNKESSLHLWAFVIPAPHVTVPPVGASPWTA